AVLDEGEGLVIGAIKAHRLQKVRESLPALRHRKL
ncbi:MAG: carbon-nitrogen hydrolase family protein, partial [Burkholderiales bacterium]